MFHNGRRHVCAWFPNNNGERRGNPDLWQDRVGSSKTETLHFNMVLASHTHYILYRTSNCIFFIGRRRGLREALIEPFS